MEQTIQTQLTADELREIIYEAVAKAVPEAVAAGLPPAKQYLSRFEVAEKLNISLTTVHYLINHGELKPVKIGRRTLFRIDDVINLPYSKYARTPKNTKS